MDVPFVDLKAQTRELHDGLLAAFESVTSRAAYTLGPELTEFEQAFAAFCGVEHCVGVSSGTDAMKLALLGAGVGPGDEVVVPVNTFIATAEAVSHLGATPVFCDCDPETALLDPEALAAVCEEREGMLSAVVPVHLYGRPCDMDAITAVAREYGLAVVEDACQAHGARYAGVADSGAAAGVTGDAGVAEGRDAAAPVAGRPCGSFGITAAFSFYPGKNLGALGDGGAVVTSDNAVAERLRLLRDHGQSEKQVHSLIGYCDRLHNLQAAFLNVKLPHLAGWNEERRLAAALYDERLRDVPGVLPVGFRAATPARPAAASATPAGPAASATPAGPAASAAFEHVYHLYVVRILAEHEEDADTDIAERLLADELARAADAFDADGDAFDVDGDAGDDWGVHGIDGVQGIDPRTMPDLSGRGLRDIRERGERRDAVREHLAAAGVQSGIHYAVPLHLQPAYAHLGYRLGDFPAAERLAPRILSLPMFPGITTEQIDHVCRHLARAVGSG